MTHVYTVCVYKSEGKRWCLSRKFLYRSVVFLCVLKHFNNENGVTARSGSKWPLPRRRHETDGMQTWVRRVVRYISSLIIQMWPILRGTQHTEMLRPNNSRLGNYGTRGNVSDKRCKTSASLIRRENEPLIRRRARLKTIRTLIVGVRPWSLFFVNCTK